MSRTEDTADRAGDLERFAVECALRAAWATEFWQPGDPDYGFTDYFEAAAARNLGLLGGFAALAADMDRRGILPPTDGDQSRLVTDGGTGEDDTEHLKMLYPEFVDRAMRSQEPVTEIREVGEHRRIYSAAQYDPDNEVVWRADIDADHHPEYDTTPRVMFSKSHPTSSAEIMQKWTSLATGRLSGPQDLGPWEALFTVFNAALAFYQEETPRNVRSLSTDTDHAGGDTDR